MSVIQETSVTVLDTLLDLDRELAGVGVELRVAAVPENAARVAERTTWYRGLVAAGRVSPSVEAALDGSGRAPPGQPPPGQPPPEQAGSPGSVGDRTVSGG